MSNKLKCLKCGNEIQSLYRHDFKWCSCGNLFIDGGNDYCRCGGQGIEDGTYEWIEEEDER